jgi:hypothetical protein
MALTTSPALAAVAGPGRNLPTVRPVLTNLPVAPWTFNIPVAVDHIPAPFVKVVADCVVETSSPTYDGKAAPAGGFADHALTGGAYTGIISVQAFLYYPNPPPPLSWWCDLGFEDSNGHLFYPVTSADGKGSPIVRPGTTFLRGVGGNL